MEFSGSKEKSVRDYLRVIFKYKIVIVIIMSIIMSIIIINNELTSQRQYVAAVKMLISGVPETDVDFYKTALFNPRLLSDTYNEILQTSTVLDRVVKKLRLDERPIDEELQYVSGIQAYLASRRINETKLQLEEMSSEQRNRFLFSMAVGRLQASISTGYDLDKPSIYTIYVKDINPNAAVVIANSLSRSFVIYNIEQQITELKLKYGEKYSSVIQLQKYIEELQSTLNGKLLPDLEALGPASIKILEQARTSSEVGGRQSVSRLLIAFSASIFLSILLVFIFDFVDQSFKSPHDVEEFLNVPVICSIPKRKSKDKLLISENNPHSTNYSIAFHNLSEQVYLIMKDKTLKTLLVIDIDVSEDASNIVANLGISLSHKGGFNVLLIDANLRNPSLSKIFNISDRPGLIDVLRDEVAFESAIKDMGSNLYVLPTSKAASNPVTFLDSSRMLDIINTGREIYDIVLFTCANLKHFSDAVILSSKIGGTALIINEGKINRQVAKRLISPLEQNNINIIGTILNSRTYVIPEVIYKIT